MNHVIWALCPDVKSFGISDIKTGRMQPGTQIAIVEASEGSILGKFIAFAEDTIAEQICREHNILVRQKLTEVVYD